MLFLKRAADREDRKLPSYDRSPWSCNKINIEEIKRMKIADKLWNWGHLEGSHNQCVNKECKMTPEMFAEKYGIKNAFLVSYAGNIQPPFDDLAKRFSALREIKWSVLGDAGTPLPEAELGNTQDIIDVLGVGGNITGGVVDDFFSPERMERFTPEVLKKIQGVLNAVGRDFWCVLYEHQLDMDLKSYLDCFDGVTFWIWNSKNLSNVELYLEKLFALAAGKSVMLGIYLWDYNDSKELETAAFEGQLQYYFSLLKAKQIEGIIFCSSTIGDAGLETTDVLKKYIAEQGNIEIG